MKTILRHYSVLTVLLFGLATTAFGQLQWSSYDTSGNLVTANVATGGDITTGGSVTFTIPANTQFFGVTKGFTPISLAAGNSVRTISYKMSVSGGFTGATAGQRIVGWGLFNSAGSGTFTDDVGYFGMLNAGNYTEPWYHPAGLANLFTGTKPGQGTTTSGFPVDNVTYSNKLYLKMNAAGTGISLGTGGGSLAAAGVAINGPSVTQYSYINPVTPLVGGVSTFDEFAFMFYNTTGSSITVTLSTLSLGNTATWDASGTNAIAPIDGGGNWSSTNINWSNGAYDNGWADGYNAVFGSGGAAGTITLTGAPPVVANITFNTNYTVSGNTLTLTNSPTITVAGINTTATIGSLIAGSGFTKEGAGLLVINGTANNTYVGNTIINNGTVQPGGTAGILNIAGNLIVNPNGMFVATTGLPGQGVFGSAVAVINGGTVTNINSGVFAAGLCVLANNARITNSGGGNSATYSVTNTDARSGSIYLTRHGFNVFNNLYKSTAGTVAIGTRPNSSGTDGYIMTLNAGTVVIDYAFTANNATRLKANSPLVFAGGALMPSNSVTTIAPSTVNPGTGGTFFNSGASSFYLYNLGSGGGGMTMGAITRKPGATFNFIGQNGLGSIGSTTANVNGIVGGWNTYGSADWTAGTSTWAALASAAYQADLNPANWGATSNVTLSASPSANVGDGTNINTLRLTAASTVTLDGALTLASGGLLVTGSGATAITGGTLKSANGSDLIIHQYASADLTIGSTLADNGGATSLTKAGTGKLILTGTDSLSGTNYLNGGVVEVSDLAKLAGGPLDMNGGTLRYTGSDATSSRAVTTRGLGPTFDIVGGTTVTQTGVITGSGDALGDLGGITKTGAGTLVLKAINNFNGETVVSNGVLAINGTNGCNSTVWDAGKVTVSGGTLGGTGLISGPVTVKSGGTISPGNSIGTLTLATNLALQSGSTTLFEVTNNAAGDLLVVQGNLTVANGTIAINVLGTALQPTTNTLITYTGTKTGSFNPIIAVVGGSLNSSVYVDESTPGQIKLVAVPQVAITVQPADLIVSTNDPATFNVTATGSAPIGYQWYFYGSSSTNTPVAQTDATNATFTIANAQTTNTGLYAVVVTNGYNSVTSRLASLIVGDVCPVLLGPVSQTVIAGNNVTFNTSVVIANPQPTFQWQTNGVNVAGATTTSLTLTNVQYGLDGTTVSVIASNSACLVTNSATLTVIVRPVITQQPGSAFVNVGDATNFSCIVTGVPAPALQWYKNSVLVPGQTAATFTFAGAQGSDIGNYLLIATNAAGSVTSSVVKLTVYSTSLVTNAGAFGPTNTATGVCYDTPLYVTFNGPVSVVNSGKIRIYNAANPVTPVDTIDMSSNSVIVSTLTTGVFLTNNVQAHSLFSGDAQVINYFPVICTGSTAAIYPHAGVMTSNQTYFVTLDPGIVVDSSGAYFAGMTDTNAWRFTTKTAGPANTNNLVVAADGSGDFVTVQGAVDSVPAGNSAYTLINIRDGNYVEIVDISGKNNLTFRGQSRNGTMVGYANNNYLTGTTAGRMAFKVNSSDIKLENLTLTNGTPQGGSQAETLLIYNSGLRCVVENCTIASRQDTILVNATTSQAYFDNCRVIGNFDYIWGSGVAYFNKCVFHTITNIYSGSYNLTAARTATAASYSTNTPWLNPNGSTYSANGFTFVGCTFESDPGVGNVTLAGSNGTAGGLDAWVNCLIDTNLVNYVTPQAGLSNTYVFWQYGNKEITGISSITLSNVQTIGVTNNDPRLLAATNAIIWFYGWMPAIAPNITGQPVGATVSQGQAASFTVSATGIPVPTYQWYQNGSPVSGATSATLNIASAVRTNAGSYTVVASNGSGSVTSSVAVLTYTGNVNPVANPSTYSRPAGYPLVIPIAGSLATYWSDADADPLALTSGISSTNGATVSYDSTSVYYTNANDVADQINYTIGDGQGGTAAGVINVVVTAPPTNSISGTVVNGNGTATLNFLGVPGYSYVVEATPSLTPPIVWTPISTNTADINGQWQVIDLQATNYPNQYYRSAYKP